MFEYKNRQGWIHTLGVSVIICTHNPRISYIERVLYALQEQTLDTSQWELVIVDNASPKPVKDIIDIHWHPQGKIIVEEKLGVINARVRGIKETKGNVLVFVDDDGVLPPGYLEAALKISQAWPMLGAWGGKIINEYEIIPPDWIRKFLEPFRQHAEERPRWSNLYDKWETIPSGGGCCVRRNVAEAFFSLVANDPIRQHLGRKGSKLSGFEDIDMVYCAIDLGFGTGIFPELSHLHLIPPQRIPLNYLVRHAEDGAFSWHVFNACRGKRLQAPKAGFIQWLIRRIRWLRLGMPLKAIYIEEARIRGYQKGAEYVLEQGLVKNNQIC